MYAHIDVSKKVSRVIRYHENKLKRGKAQLIDGNTAKDLGDMSDRDKLYHFQRRNSLNEGTVQNTMHVLVSWPADETVDNTRMRTVAREYIREMGWTDQPYLVYRHDDRQHPHLHIVASNLSREGERLTLHRNDYFRTHALVERLDRQYVQHVGQQLAQEIAQQQVAPEPLLPRLSAALDEVVPTYKYTSLAELNAVLDQHQLRVSRCQEDSPTYLTGGLIYVPLTAER